MSIGEHLAELEKRVAALEEQARERPTVTFDVCCDGKKIATFRENVF